MSGHIYASTPQGVLGTRACAPSHGKPTPAVINVAAVLREPGKPLSETARSYWEPRFGHDFSRVRIHADARAAEALESHAFTVGRHIVFSSQMREPETERDQSLLAHELSHVVQQRNTSDAEAMSMNRTTQSGERSAEGVARGLQPAWKVASEPALNLSAVGIQRAPLGEEGSGQPTEVCGELLPELSDADGRFNRAKGEYDRLQEELAGVRDDITVATGDIRELAEQITAYDAEIADTKREGQPGQQELQELQDELAKKDDELRAITERIAELQILIEEGRGRMDLNEVAFYSRELVEKQDQEDELADKREELAREIEPKMEELEEDQTAISAKIRGRDKAESVRAEVERFRDDLQREAPRIEAERDEQWDLQEAARELKAALRAEAKAADCEFE